MALSNMIKKMEAMLMDLWPADPLICRLCYITVGQKSDQKSLNNP